MDSETLVSLFYGQVETQAESPMLLVKHEGTYREVSWRVVAERVREIASGLLSLGVQKGDRIGVLSENRQEWIETDLAILSVGAITVALHAPLTAKQVQEQFQNSQPVVVFLSNREQAEKLQSIHKSLSGLKAVIAFEEAACGERITSLEAFCQAGRSTLSQNQATLTARIQNISPKDVAAIIYTSGTTGESKGAMLIHRNFVSNVQAMANCWNLPEDKVLLCYLPLTHVYARTCDLYLALGTGRIIALAECVETLLQNLQEVRPHHIIGVPRVYEKIVSAARPLIQAGNPAKTGPP